MTVDASRITDAVAADTVWVKRMNREDSIAATNPSVPITAELKVVDMLIDGFVTSHTAGSVHFNKASVIVCRDNVKLGIRCRSDGVLLVLASQPR